MPTLIINNGNTIDEGGNGGGGITSQQLIDAIAAQAAAQAIVDADQDAIAAGEEVDDDLVNANQDALEQARENARNIEQSLQDARITALENTVPAGLGDWVEGSNIPESLAQVVFGEDAKGQYFDLIGSSNSGWSFLQSDTFLPVGETITIVYDLDPAATATAAIRGIVGGAIRDIVLFLDGDPNDVSTLFNENNPGSIIAQSVTVDNGCVTMVVEAVLDITSIRIFPDYGLTGTASNNTATGTLRVRALTGASFGPNLDFLHDPVPQDARITALENQSAGADIETLVFRNDVTVALWTATEDIGDFDSSNPDPATSDKYSILSTLEDFRRDNGKLRFRLFYPTLNEEIIFEQTNNFVQDHIDNVGQNAVVGLEIISSSSDAVLGVGGSSPFVGFNNSSNPSAIIEGNSDGVAWWYPIGQTVIFGGGIPAFTDGGNNITDIIELYVITENPLSVPALGDRVTALENAAPPEDELVDWETGITITDEMLVFAPRVADGQLTSFRLMAANSPHTITRTTFNAAEEALYDEVGPASDFLDGFDDRIVNANNGASLVLLNSENIRMNLGDSRQMVLFGKRNNTASQMILYQGENGEEACMRMQANNAFLTLDTPALLQENVRLIFPDANASAAGMVMVATSVGTTFTTLDWQPILSATQVTDAIAVETTARTAADSALDTRIISLEGQDFAALMADVVANMAGITGNDGDIATLLATTSANTTAQQANAAAITNLANNLATESTDRATADSTLQGNIDTEATARANADAAEANQRSTADAAQVARLNALETWLAAGLPGQVPVVPTPDAEPTWQYPYGFGFVKDEPADQISTTPDMAANLAASIDTTDFIPGLWEITIESKWSYNLATSDFIAGLYDESVGAQDAGEGYDNSLDYYRKEPRDVAGASSGTANGGTNQRESLTLSAFVQIVAGENKIFSFRYRPEEAIIAGVYNVKMTMKRVSD